ncbi:hypothetical protein CPC08DRAFT_714547, partial [Agrocybe pediades]
MSRASDFSSAQLKAYIGADLNLLIDCLLGVYTGIFPVTLYLYIHKENRTRARDRIIIGCITALYLTVLLNNLMNWLYTNILIGTDGGTRIEMFVESVNQKVPVGESVFAAVTSYLGYILADGLLVWRCFHSCGRSICRSLLPLVLFSVETVLIITYMAYRILRIDTQSFITDHTAAISNALSAATLVSVAVTSLVSTGLICLQIWRHTTLSSRSRKNYQAIINALIQSSALYTTAVLFIAVLAFADIGDLELTRVFTVSLIVNFAGPITHIASGLGPTLMISTLAVSSSQEGAEVSSARLPSNLISHVSHATGDDMPNGGADLEMQQIRSIPADEEQNGEIETVHRNDDELEHDGENRLKTI